MLVCSRNTEVNIFLSNFDRLYWKQKKHARSAAQYDKLIDIMIRQYGPDSMDLVPVYQEYGKISFYLCPIFLTNYNHIGSVMLSMHASSVVDRGFKPQPDQFKYYKIGICCFSAKHAVQVKAKTIILTQQSVAQNKCFWDSNYLSKGKMIDLL